MYLLIIALPILGTLFASLFGRFIGGKGAGILTSFGVGFSFFLSCIAFYEVALNKSVCVIELTP
jgi:NADH:ubiquinone oxidoreductase subunit 5 (subunit L)/multisubunit Na+/H+ antiporter MnhA subunit